MENGAVSQGTAKIALVLKDYRDRDREVTEPDCETQQIVSPKELTEAVVNVKARASPSESTSAWQDRKGMACTQRAKGVEWIGEPLSLAGGEGDA